MNKYDKNIKNYYVEILISRR